MQSRFKQSFELSQIFHNADLLSADALPTTTPIAALRIVNFHDYWSVAALGGFLGFDCIFSWNGFRTVGANGGKRGRLRDWLGAGVSFTVAAS